MKQNLPYLVLADVVVVVGSLGKKRANEQWKKNGLAQSYKTHLMSDIMGAGVIFINDIGGSGELTSLDVR